MRTRFKLRWLSIMMLVLATLWWSSVSFAQSGDEGPTTPPFPAAGEPIYQIRCANCHGPAGQGDGPQAGQANLAVADLTDLAAVRETTPARWFDIISNGVSGEAMPPFGAESSNPLRQAERWDLVFYLYTLSTSQAQIAMGQALYERGCSECHGADGAGTATAASDFTDLTQMANLSQADLFAGISDASIDGHDAGLVDVQVWALADYVRAFSYNYQAPAAEGMPSSSAAPVASSPFTGGSGVVTGQILNGTGGATPPQGLVVSLRAFDMNAAFVDSITTTVAADGSFRIEGIDPTTPVQLEPMTVYQDIPYFGTLQEAITLSPDRSEANVNIIVYETSTTPTAIRIERLHIVFDVAPGLIQVAELYILSNDSDRTYVGTLEEGTLRLTAPPNALEFQPAGDPNRYRTLADGVADTVSIPPGLSTAESVVVYNLPYDGDLELTRPLPYDVSKLNIFVPADSGIAIAGSGIQAGEPFQTQDSVLATYAGDDLSASDGLTLRLTGEIAASSSSSMSSPHQRPGPNETQGIAIGIVTLIGSAVLSFLYWQGRLSWSPGQPGPDRRSDLFQAIAALDNDFEAGHVKEKQYRAKRAKLKDELIALFEAEE